MRHVREACEHSGFPLADAEKLLLSSGRVFPWHKAKPRCQIASFLELLAVSNGRQERSCAQCPNPKDCHEPSCDILATGDRLYLACDVANALFQLAQIGKKVCEQLTHCRREIIGVIFESSRQVDLEEACALAQGDPVFEAESSHLVDQTRSRSDHLISDPV